MSELKMKEEQNKARLEDENNASEHLRKMEEINLEKSLDNAMQTEQQNNQQQKTA
jgi:hypothetical protein